MVKKTQQIDTSKPLRRVVSVVRNGGVQHGEPHFRCIEVNPKCGDAMKGMFWLFLLLMSLLLIS